MNPTVKNLFEKIAATLPQDAIYLMRLVNLQDMLVYIDTDIRPNMEGNPSLQEACKIIFDNKQAKDQISSHFKFIGYYVQEYLAHLK